MRMGDGTIINGRNNRYSRIVEYLQIPVPYADDTPARTKLTSSLLTLQRFQNFDHRRDCKVCVRYGIKQFEQYRISYYY